jgi:hypothetical protein
MDSKTMPDTHTELWLTLIPLLTDEDLIRLIRRTELKLPATSQRYDLVTYFEAELLAREAAAAITVPPLKSQHKHE